MNNRGESQIGVWRFTFALLTLAKARRGVNDASASLPTQSKAAQNNFPVNCDSSQVARLGACQW